MPRLRESSDRQDYPSEYNAWRNLNQRHNNVDSSWRNSFKMFLFDVGIKPSAGLTLGRIDENKDYGPYNCKWMSRQEKRNRRMSQKIKQSSCNNELIPNNSIP